MSLIDVMDVAFKVALPLVLVWLIWEWVQSARRRSVVPDVDPSLPQTLDDYDLRRKVNAKLRGEL